VAVVVAQVPTDGLGAGIQPRLGQLVAEPGDQVDQFGR